MILIADAGSTKTDWAILTPSNDPVRFTSAGINPMVMPHGDITAILHSEVIPHLAGRGIPSGIWYYGAGCTEAVSGDMAALLSSATGCRDCHVHSDMLGAARSTCGDTPGVVCILGTGSNSCLYDGSRLSDNIPPMGYILGDEGSGAALGRRLVADIYKRQLPRDLCEAFASETSLRLPQIMEAVYRSPGPNRFLASLTRFLGRHIDRPEIHSLVSREFRRFIARCVAPYGCPPGTPVHFVGSVAWHFRPLIEAEIEAASMTCGHILPAPMDGLIRYHTLRQQQ